MTVDIEKLESLAKAATQGNWYHHKHGVIKGGPVVQFFNGSSQQQIVMTTGADWMIGGEKYANADFIAAANPAAVLELLADIERLKAQLATERLSGFAAAFYQIADAVGVTGARAATPEQVFNGEVMPAIEAFRKDAERYRWLRSRDVDTISKGGVFAGMTPQNLVINEETLDEAVDAAMSK